MRLKFTKMQGLGNDFVVIDGLRQQIELTTSRVKWLADRHFGIGCDQVLLVEGPSNPQNDFRYRIFNCDGGEVEQCGNGARCFVHFVRDQGLTNKRSIRVETHKGVIVPELCDDGTVRVDMGIPTFTPDKVPFLTTEEALTYELDVNGIGIQLSVLSMGNPHAVLIVDSVETAKVEELGPSIERHVRFPRRVNVGFMQVVDRGKIKLRVYERAAGETLACGTGSCAAVVAGIRRGLLDNRVEVTTRGGKLRVEWNGTGAVKMQGPAQKVFEGVAEIE